MNHRAAAMATVITLLIVIGIGGLVGLMATWPIATSTFLVVAFTWFGVYSEIKNVAKKRPDA